MRKKPGINTPNVDTADLLKALRATHSENSNEIPEELPPEVIPLEEPEEVIAPDEIVAEIEGHDDEEVEIEGDIVVDDSQSVAMEGSLLTDPPPKEKPPGLIQSELDTAPAVLEPVEIDELARELADAEAKSILESVIFASHNPVSFGSLKNLFVGTNVSSEKLTDLITSLQTDFAGGDRGVELAEVAGGYQLRTKLESAPWLKRLIKGRTFRLSGPALETLSIVAYKQPVIKSEIDQIRGVESSHLLRALMEKNLVRFAGKSDLPGKPMLYGTTKEFLELFGLRNIRELPTLSEIDELIPEGIGEVSEIQDGETLGTLSDKMGLPQGKSYSDGENELLGITDDLSRISTSSEFFEQEKIRQREKRDNDRAQDLKERAIMGETLDEADAKWLARFDARIEALAAAAAAPTESEPETILPAPMEPEPQMEI